MQTPDESGEIRARLPRRKVLGGLAAAGVASTLVAACNDKTGGATASGGGDDSQITTDNTAKGATEATKAANKKVMDSLPFNERGDFDDAKRGMIARPDTLTIKDANGNVVWDLEEYKKYIADDKPAPDTVNPSLWRNAQLCMEYGLFEVVPDKIYQVRGYDLSNITFIKGDTGWIAYDTLISPETAKAALDLVNEKLGSRPIVAVIHSHSHVDHYGGVRGIINQADVDSGKVKVIAPQAFVEDAVSENVIAGNAMSRRAVYMYGALVSRNAQGGVNGGLGMTVSTAVPSLIIPTDIIITTGQKMTIDGMQFPPELNNFWPDRGYYGTLKHNTRAVYQRYMGWYDGNPSDLDDLPPQAAAKKYVEYMGGEDAILQKAKNDFDEGNYRWTAMVLKQVVFANPDSVNGKNLLADSYEQMGYQAESGPWRSVYLQGAYELRNGVPTSGGTDTASPDTIDAMPPEMVFDYLAVRLNGPKAAGKKIALNVDFTDLKKQYVTVENGVLNYSDGLLPQSDASLKLTKATMNDIQLGKVTLADAISASNVTLEGNRQSVDDFVGLLDTFNLWFNIVTP